MKLRGFRAVFHSLSRCPETPIARAHIPLRRLSRYWQPSTPHSGLNNSHRAPHIRPGHIYKNHSPYSQPQRPLRASSVPYLLVLVVVFGGAVVYDHTFREAEVDSKSEDNEAKNDEEEDGPVPDLPRTPEYSEMPTPTGHLGNLTADQEAKLRQLWAVTLKTFGVQDPTQSNGAPETDVNDTASEVDVSLGGKGEDKKKKRMSMFRKKHDKDKDSIASGTSTPNKDPSKSTDTEDKYGQVKEFHEILATTSPEALRAAFWGMVKADHPDALLLRFLRARKWDVDRALVMLISTMKWRAVEMHVDDDVVKRGEGAALEDSRSSDSTSKKAGEDFLAQLRLGKSFLHGVDKEGRPITVVRARLHKAGDQSEQSLERYTVYVIETARLVLRSPVETACIIFDMSHFTMANMDYAPVKFMIKIFEANYPESLGIILVHKAPWLFQGVWAIIKGWLDPVVASKVHFTKHAEDLQSHIPKSQIIKELGGDEDWEYTYIEPQPGENDLMKQDAPRSKLETERRTDVLEYQNKTFDWIHDPTASTVKKERDTLAAKMNANYWALDPYIRARTLYDRQGMIEKGGKINFYPAVKSSAAVTNGGGSSRTAAPPPTQAAHADDVD